MGSVRLGIDLDATLALRDKYALKVFVETGTYRAGSTLLAAPHFEWVYSIEGDRSRFEKTQAGLGNDRPKNATFIYGDSRHELARVLATIAQPCLIWADAHWCGGGAAEAHALGDECPLREELEAVNASAYTAQHVLMIDDARLFTSPPPYPHIAEQWLTFTEIEALLSPRKVYIQDDVIYAEPISPIALPPNVPDFLKVKATSKWLEKR